MKKSIFVAVMMLFGSCLGCGPGATDTSTTPPPMADEDVTQELEQAMESGGIDPATYGQSGGAGETPAKTPAEAPADGSSE